MTAESNKSTIAAYIRAVDEGNLDALRDFALPGVLIHLPGFPPLGLETAIESGRHLRAAFPDLTHGEARLVAEGDLVVLATTLEGTQTGSFQGLPPTGRRISIDVVTTFRLEGGKIAEVWEVADLLHLFLQIGFSLQPPPPSGNGHAP